MASMAKILDCIMTDCSYNRNKMCHTMAITVGGGNCPMCDTYVSISTKGGLLDSLGGVGSCKVQECEFNNSLECRAEGIHVKMHSNHAECATFRAK